jgi:hypothetical protein
MSVPTTQPQEKLVPITARPGVMRDGTVLESQSYTDAQWIRFQRGRPRKMGGMKNISNNFTALSRGCVTNTQGGQLFVHSGSSDLLEEVIFDSAGFGAGLIDRTPSGFTTSADNVWQFDQLYDTQSTAVTLIAHAAQNLSAVDNNVAAPIYFGDAFGSSALTAITAPSATGNPDGGVCVLHPYLFYYGSGGTVGWSVANTPQDLNSTGSGNARVTEGKVIYGVQNRGGQSNSPAGLFFATDSLVQAAFIGGDPVFAFNAIANGYSILSSRCVVEYDGIYYWPGVDRFLSFNGVIQEVQNDQNVNDFFDNLNQSQRQKVFGVKMPRWGEIWWFYPRGAATECTNAVILNLRERCWYDVQLGRSAGTYNSTFRYPILFDANFYSDAKTKLWMHELGTDLVDGQLTAAIPAWFETPLFTSTFMGFQGGEIVREDVNMRVKRFEPDFRSLVGSMDLQFIGRKYAQSEDVLLKEYDFDATTEKVDTRVQARGFRIRMESNVAGGDFQMGNPLMLVQKGDGRP